MNDPLDIMRTLAEQARQEEAPRGHVARKVLARVTQEKPGFTPPLAVFAAVAAAASIVLFCALVLPGATVSPADPLGDFFQLASTLAF